MRAAFLTVLVSLVPMFGATIAAQTGGEYGDGYSSGTGNLSSRVQMAYLERHGREASRSTRWMQVVVLWRGQPSWAAPTGALDAVALRAATDEYRRAEASAIVANAVVLGGQAGAVAYLAQVDSGRTAVTVLGQRFALPPRDSALIVMVDRIDGSGGRPAIVGTAVVDGRLPDLPPTRMWTSGDTIFTVHQRNGLDEGREAILLRDRKVAAFWH